MPAAASGPAERRRLYLCGLLAALCALGAYLAALGLLRSHAYLLGLLVLGFAVSYFLPRRFQVNSVYVVAIVAFIVAGIQIAGLREEMDAAVIAAGYVRTVALLLVISSFKTFRPKDMWFCLGVAALLLLLACVSQPGLLSFGAALAFLAFSVLALYRPGLSGRAAA